MRIRKSVGFALLVGVVAGLLVWRAPDTVNPGSSAVPRTLERARNDPPRVDNVAGSAAAEVRPTAGVPTGQPVSADLQQRLRRAIATGDALEWEPIIGELRNVRYDRLAAISILQSLLGEKDPMVRVRAAQQLLELGSLAGVPALAGVIRDGAAGKEVSVMAVATAASALHQFRSK